MNGELSGNQGPRQGLTEVVVNLVSIAVQSGYSLSDIITVAALAVTAVLLVENTRNHK